MAKKHLLKKELWIGFAKVEQPDRKGVLGYTDGAYTNAIGFANSRAGFRASVKKELEELGLKLTRLENAETLLARLSKYSIDRELRKLAKEIANNQRVGFGTFHAF
jgi:hypothetical protein